MPVHRSGGGSTPDFDLITHNAQVAAATFLQARASSPRAVRAGETSSPWPMAAATCRPSKGVKSSRELNFHECARGLEARAPRKPAVPGSRRTEPGLCTYSGQSIATAARELGPSAREARMLRHSPGMTIEFSFYSDNKNDILVFSNEMNSMRRVHRIPDRVPARRGSVPGRLRELERVERPGGCVSGHAVGGRGVPS